MGTPKLLPQSSGFTRKLQKIVSSLTLPSMAYCARISAGVPKRIICPLRHERISNQRQHNARTLARLCALFHPLPTLMVPLLNTIISPTQGNT